MSTRDTPLEEPWERHIQELLSSLPPVDPPDGFLERAIDRRPKYAGRLCVVTGSVLVVALVVLVGLGWVGDPRAVVPPIHSLGERHGSLSADLLGRGGSGPLAGLERVPDRPAAPELPPSFQMLGSWREHELVSFVYVHHHDHVHDDELVSLVMQPGPVAWRTLGPSGRTEVDGRRVWIDADRRTLVFESGRWAVTVLGLDVDEGRRLVAQFPPPRRSVSAGDRLRALVRDVARQAGFP